MEADNSEALVLNNLSFSYTIGVEKRQIFSNASASFPIGVNIVRGPNGSGKSTLLKTITGFVYPQFGNVYYKNAKNLLRVSRNLRPTFFIAQNPFDICSSNLSIVENLSTAIPEMSGFFNSCSSTQVLKHLSKTLNSIGVDAIWEYSSNFWQKEMKKLSGGETQCICLYMSILSQKSIILLDEPTTGLDDLNYKRLVDILKIISLDKIIIITTHDERLDTIKSQNLMIEDYSLNVIY